MEFEEVSCGGVFCLSIYLELGMVSFLPLCILEKANGLDTDVFWSPWAIEAIKSNVLCILKSLIFEFGLS